MNAKEFHKDIKALIQGFEINETFYAIGYNDATNEMVAGTVGNSGIIPEFTLEYEDCLTLDQNLQNLYSMIIENN